MPPAMPLLRSYRDSVRISYKDCAPTELKIVLLRASQPTPDSLPIRIVLRAEMVLHELFFERNQPEIDEPEKKNRRNNEPERFHSEEAAEGDE